MVIVHPTDQPSCMYYSDARNYMLQFHGKKENKTTDPVVFLSLFFREIAEWQLRREAII